MFLERSNTKDILVIQHMRKGVVISERETAPCGSLKGIGIALIQMFSGGMLAKKWTVDLVTDVGLAGLAGLMSGDVTDIFEYIAYGTGTTAPTVGDTTMETEVERATATVTRETTTKTNDTLQLIYTKLFTSNVAVTEVGILNAAAVGVLLCRQTFSAINVVSGDSLKITYKVQVGT